MIVGGCCPLPENNSDYQLLVFDHHDHLVGNCSDHFDIVDYHYDAPFDNGYQTYPHHETENYLGMTESVILWPLLCSVDYTHIDPQSELWNGQIRYSCTDPDPN